MDGNDLLPEKQEISMEIIEVGIVMNVIDEHPDSSFNENN
jgi:hypothetical protein